jgi:hypothetical protein
VLQSNNCIPHEAMRNFQSNVAGKAVGTSSIAGRKLENVTASRMNPNAANKEPFQAPNRRLRVRASCSVSPIEARESATQR